MDDSQAYAKKLAEIRAIPDERIKQIKNIPVSVYIQEADNLYQWCQQDKDELIGQGLSWDLVIDLPLRIEVLVKAEASWNEERIAGDETAQKWAKESGAAYELRKKLLHDFRFAFQKNGELLKIVNESAKMKGHTGLIQGLNDLAVLGKANPQVLSGIQFDMSLLDKAAEAAGTLSPLLAGVSVYKLGDKETKKVRDQAFTHLKEAVDEIYRFGQHAFWQNDERRRGYRSEYLHRKRIKRVSPPKKSE